MNRRHISAITTLLAMLIAGRLTAEGQPTDVETNLKAAFLYNFTRYIDWPSNSDRIFVIGIVGSSDLKDALQEIARSNSADNRRIVIRQFETLDQITPCQMLFISSRSKLSLSGVLGKTCKGELTVSERPGAAREGTMFNFVRVGDKLKFEVNTKALATSDLRVSSQLLRLAIVVN